MPSDRQLRLFEKALNKKAFMPLTDQAMAAQCAPAGAPPMDPAMMGGAPVPPPPGTMPPVDPNTGMPMDPAMMGAPAGAPPMMPPVDPNTGMPMDPAMMGAPAPAAPVATGDMAIDMLLQMGAMIVDPSGQPVPPETIAQLVAEINAIVVELVKDGTVAEIFANNNAPYTAPELG